jgi:hypothetical protein
VLRCTVQEYTYHDLQEKYFVVDWRTHLSICKRKLEKKERALALEELLKNPSPFEVRARLVEEISKNWRFKDLLLKIPQRKNPLLAEPGPRTALERTLRGILSAQGRSFDSLEDLHNLQCDLVHSEKTRRAALSPFLESYGVSIGGEPEP